MRQKLSSNLRSAKLQNVCHGQRQARSRFVTPGVALNLGLYQNCFCCAVFTLLLLASVSAVDNNGSVSSSHVRTVTVNAGDNVTLVCSGPELQSNKSIGWIHDTKDSERIVSG